ncbi:hypothetical protein Dsin_015833 [Dipteronia sinensis]|uniref:Reverse transcriptase domain-containing protein n=1 Tax=Dipteronia sinensis TaxID=43782 RepID=A0AAE0AD74_9ROSI|nr:hypothetical protein Dsin_015833 [Dipteronia sinensis]
MGLNCGFSLDSMATRRRIKEAIPGFFFTGYMGYQICPSFVWGTLTKSLMLLKNRNAIGFECIHAIRNKKRNEGSMVLTINMSEAYDRVEMSFLAKMLSKLGFSDAWVSRVMWCVSSVSFFFLINDEIYGSLHSSRGLRQGDPFHRIFSLSALKAFPA